MSQSRLGSFVESCVNTAVGFDINFMANMLVLPLISVVRGYTLRRLFNAFHRRGRNGR